MRRNSHPWWCVLRLLIAVPSAWGSLSLARADEPAAPASVIFRSEKPLRFRLEAPFATVTRQRAAPEYQPGRLVYRDTADNEVALDLRVRVRGKSRLELCAFPPLLLNFRAGTLAGTAFEGQNRLKLVTHCESSQAYEQFVLLEYLAYRVLNLLTDRSLRVRLAEVTYYDSDRARELVTKPGFLVEDEEQFAARSSLTTLGGERVDASRYDQEALSLIEMFQYFIGNTDWSASAGPAGDACCHNVVPLAREDGSLLPIPYDFDSTGIVNAPPDERLPIRTVRQRLYRGECRDLAELRASFEPFEAKRAEITALFEQPPRLTEQTSNSARRYIDEFYALIADPERVQRVFRSDCAG
jgi:hypothetical protein